jgi:hypothetical protein
MTEDSITKICSNCGECFSCTDGDWFCSLKCSDKWESRQEDDEE